MPSLRDLAAHRLLSVLRRPLRRKGKVQFGVEQLESRDNPAPVQFFYIPMAEAATNAAFDTMVTNTTVSATQESITAITVTENNTHIWYDQWEDGYEAILGTPRQSTTQIWGDGNNANGIAPGFANDPNGLASGTVLRLRNTVNVPRDTGAQPLLFDSPDKFGADKTLAVSRAQFPTLVNGTGGSVIASAVEVRDTRYYDTSFTAPVGVDTGNATSTNPASNSIFSYSAFFVQAAYDNTHVQIDANNDGDFTDPDDRDVILNQGETVASGQNVMAGGRVVASKRVQADLLTGQIGGQYTSRTYALFSDAQLADNYFTPVGYGGTGDDPTQDDVRLYVFNPTGSSIDVVQENSGGTVTTKTIAAGTGTFFDVTYNAGTRLYSTGGQKFAAVGVHDATGNSNTGVTHDWGFSLQPVPALSTLAVVGLGVGNSANPPSSATGVNTAAGEEYNSSPIFATALGNTTLYVDDNGDGTVDHTIAVTRLQSVRLRDVTDNDYDNSGMKIYTTDGTLISVTWGEDGTAPTGSPGFDAGSTVPAIAVPEFYKFVDFAPGGDVNGDGFYNSGDRLRYTLRIRNIGQQPVNTMVLTDGLPSSFVTYLSGTTQIDLGSGFSAISDDGSGTAFPLDGSGYGISTIAIGGVIIVTFDVTINPGLPTGLTTITNTANLAYDIFNLPALADVTVRGAIGDTVYRDDDGNGTQNGSEPGIAGVTVVLYRDNNGSGTLDGGDTVVATRTTDANGKYQFADLDGGDYLVDVTDATGRLLGSTLTVGTDPRAVTLSAGGSVQTADFGYRGTGSIGQRVFIDANGNGSYDAGEGQSGVTVRVSGDMDGDGTVSASETLTTTTGANGLYSFTNLWVAGGVTYTVVVDIAALPAGLVNTIDPDGGTANQSSLTLTPAAPTNNNQNFGYRGPGVIGDRIYLDQNGNGTYDTGEGLAGARVTVSGDFDGNGTVDAGETLTATTDATGYYQFTGLRAPAGGLPYTVVVVPSTLPRDSAGNPLPNTVDPDGGTANQSVVTLTAAVPTSDTQDFGYRGDGVVGDQIFLDVNNNGTPDAGEGIANVVVRLIGDVDGNGTAQTFTVTTDTDGNYTFGNLPVRDPAGNLIAYTVAVDTATLPAGLTNTIDPDGGTANQSSLVLNLVVTNLAQDFGYRGSGVIGSSVFLDVNNNGTPDAGEGIAGVRVRLVGDFDGDGTAETVTTTTDTNGQYQFTGLRTTPGGVPYTVVVDSTTLPASVNTTPTTDPQGPLDGSATATLTNAAPTNTSQNFGYRGTGGISGIAFLDVNNNGTPNAGEGLSGVRVRLTGDLDGDGDIDTVTTTTGAGGVYQFTGLRTTPGGVPYTVTVDTTTLPQDGPGTPVPNTVDPDGGNNNTSAVTLTDAVPTNTVQDYGYRNTTSGIIGDTVFLDVNGNGTADPGEGITGVRVVITADVNGNGTTQTFTATTDANGHYLFSNLPVRTPGGALIPYTVTVTAADLPQGVTNTVDPDGGNNSTSTLTLNPASPVDLNQRFGYRGVGSFGDRVFLDLNNNGVWNVGEGITTPVVLTADVIGDGVQDLTLTVTTGADGDYLFGNLPVNDRNGTPINYTVRVPAAGLPTGVSNTVDPDGTLDGTWTGTLATGPGAPNRSDIDFGYRGTGSMGNRVWLDANGNQVQGPIATEPGLRNVGLTLTYAGQDGIFGNADDVTTNVTTDANGNYLFANLPAGTFRVTVNTANLPVNVTQTFDLDGTGTANTAAATLTTGQTRNDVNFGYRGAANLGNRVWLDQNRNGQQDPGEGGIPGAVVELRLAGPDGVLGNADDFRLTTTTGANGVYLFEGLPVSLPGGDSFRATVLSLPAPGVTPVSDLDSGVGAGDATAAGVLAPAQIRGDVNFGYAGVGRISGVVFSDPNNDGVRQPGETAIPGTVLVLEGADVYGNTIRDPLTGGTLTVTADANGDYAFTNLPAGFYSVHELQPTGFLDGTDTPGSAGGVAGQGTADTDRITQITLTAGSNSVNNTFAELSPSSASGTVYEDRNNNGVQDPSEPGIPGVVMVLTGNTDRGPVAITLTTDANGRYLFPNLRPGTYTLVETQPATFGQGRNAAGTAGGALGGTDVIQSFTLAPGLTATGYQFGEIVRSLSVVPSLPVDPVQPWETSKRMFLNSTQVERTLSVPDFAALGSMNTNRPIQFIATGDGVGGSEVRVFDLTDGVERFRFHPFGGFTGGVRTAVGDVTGDGIPDIVAAAGPGGGPHVVIYNGDTGAVVQSFFAFDERFHGGMFVTTGDFDGDGVADVAVGADSGGGPHVKVFRSGDPNQLLSSFWGIDDENYHGGVRLAAGDVNGDGRADLVVSTASGGPRVAVYDGRSLSSWNPTWIGWDFYAFEPTFSGGVYVTVGDVDGDGFADVIAGAGEGGGPRVTTFSGRDLAVGQRTVIGDVFAFDPAGNNSGVRVAATDLDGDGRAELFVGTGPGVRPVARFLNPRTGTVLSTFSPDYMNVISGVYVG